MYVPWAKTVVVIIGGYAADADRSCRVSDSGDLGSTFTVLQEFLRLGATVDPDTYGGLAMSRVIKRREEVCRDVEGLSITSSCVEHAQLYPRREHIYTL